jgi:hypothetical protein
MRHALLLAAFLLLSSTASAIAANLTINFTNQSGEAINGLALTSKESPEAPVQDTLESFEPADESNLQSAETPVQDTLEALEPPVQNILAAPIAAGDSGAVMIDAAEGECIFKLTFTFASGKVLERADTDICQADGIVVE